MKKVLIASDSRNGKAAEVIEHLRPKLAESAELVEIDLKEKPDLSKTHADLVCVFGGDGSLLRTLGYLDENLPPIVGINVGRLGFLTEFSEDEFAEAYEDILSERLKPSMRMMVEVALQRTGEELCCWHGLNEAVLIRLHAIQMIAFRVTINGNMVTEVRGDGVLVSTPTGSTAYSLSAGGSIVVPGTEALCVTPVNPHTVTSRPLVVSAEATVEIELLTDRNGVVLSVDGRDDREVLKGDVVRVRRSGRRCQLIENSNFFDTLGKKLNWGGSATYGKD